MEVHITHPELEARLTQSAAQQGCHPDDLVQDVLATILTRKPVSWRPSSVEMRRSGAASM